MRPFKLRWKRWLKPRYVWMRIKRRFGWRPEWEQRIMSQKLQPDRIIMSQETYDDLMSWANEDSPIDSKKVRPE
mgnify:CR=1 FL=1